MSHVLITGASRGIGLGLTQAYLARGSHVTAIARQPAAAVALSALQPQYPDTLRTLACDLNSTDASTTIQQALSHRQLDRVILNAGISGPDNQGVEHVTPAVIADLFLTNAVAPLRLARMLRPLIPRGGVLAFTSSILGSVELGLAPDMALYGASKAALNSLIRTWANEQGAALDIQLLALHPGWVRTDMGGRDAPLSVEESVSDLVRVIEQAAGGRGCQFLDHQGQTLAW